MELLTVFLPHLFHYGFIVIAYCFVFVVLVWGFGLTVAPVHWDKKKQLFSMQERNTALG